MTAATSGRAGLGRVGVVVAARTASTRLPGKALLPLDGTPMILYQFARLRPMRRADLLLLATTTLASDDALAAAVSAAGIPVFRGASDDLIARYLAAAAAHGLDTLVRVTGDCPFTDAASLDFCLEQAVDGYAFDLATTKGAFPVGIDYEIFPAAALRRVAGRRDLGADDREHLTLYFYKHAGMFTVRTLTPPAAWPRSGASWTVDTPDDYRRAAALAAALADPLAPVEAVLATAGAP